MANRVVIGNFNGEQVCRISRPGFDVLDSALSKDNLVFDSRWVQTSSVLYSGSAVTDQSNGVSNFKTITYPVAFAAGTLPLVIVVYRVRTNSGNTWHDIGGSFSDRTAGGYVFRSTLRVTETTFQLGSINGVVPFNYWVLDNYFHG